jgi:hypothetical protein
MFILYNLPGVLALLMTALGAFPYVAAVHPVKRKLGNVSRVLLVIAAVFGSMAAVGQLGRFDALTTGGVSFGVLFLGLALFLAGLATSAKNTGTGRYGPVQGIELMLLGITGMLILLLRPLVFALQLLPLAFGTAACVLFGVGWILLVRGAGLTPAGYPLTGSSTLATMVPRPIRGTGAERVYSLNKSQRKEPS